MTIAPNCAPTVVQRASPEKKGAEAPFSRSQSAASARLQLRQQPQELDVQPHQRDHQAERAVPLHVLRRAALDAGLDEVEVQHQVQRRDRDHEQAEADADDAVAVDHRDLDPEEAQHRSEEHTSELQSLMRTSYAV